MASTGPRCNQYSLATPKKRPRTLDISESSIVPPLRSRRYKHTLESCPYRCSYWTEELPPIDRAPKRRLYPKLMAVFKGIGKFSIYIIGKL